MTSIIRLYPDPVLDLAPAVFTINGEFYILASESGRLDPVDDDLVLELAEMPDGA